MSFIDNILGRTPAAAPAEPPQATPPQQTAPVQSDKEPPNPLDIYSKMYETKANDEAPPNFEIDDSVLSDVSSKLNFTSNIDQALMQKAQQGDAQAMIDLMQNVAQRAYSTALKHTTALTEAHLTRRGEYDKKALSKNVKQSLTQEAISALPNANHSVVKTELARVAENLARQNPDASPQAIAKAAQEYLMTISNAINPTPKKDSSKQTAGEVQDWEAFLTNSN